jgi:hypothetical protein
MSAAKVSQAAEPPSQASFTSTLYVRESARWQWCANVGCTSELQPKAGLPYGWHGWALLWARAAVAAAVLAMFEGKNFGEAQVAVCVSQPTRIDEMLDCFISGECFNSGECCFKRLLDVFRSRGRCEC